MRPGGRRVHLVSLSSLGFALGVVGIRQFHWSVLWGSSGTSVSLGSLGCALGVVRFVMGRWVQCGAPWVSAGSSGVHWLLWLRPWCRRVHSL